MVWRLRYLTLNDLPILVLRLSGFSVVCGVCSVLTLCLRVGYLTSLQHVSAPAIYHCRTWIKVAE